MGINTCIGYIRWVFVTVLRGGMSRGSYSGGYFVSGGTIQQSAPSNQFQSFSSQAKAAQNQKPEMMDYESSNPRPPFQPRPPRGNGDFHPRGAYDGFGRPSQRPQFQGRPPFRPRGPAHFLGGRPPTGPGGIKRKTPLKDQSDMLKQRRNAQILACPTKNAIQKCYEIFGQEKVKYETSGEPIAAMHAGVKRFGETVIIDEVKYAGEGTTKKDAKLAACTLALQRKFPDLDGIMAQLGPENKQAKLGKGGPVIASNGSTATPPGKANGAEAVPTSKTPVTQLYELLSQKAIVPSFDCIQTETVPSPLFKVTIGILTKQFEGFGRNKKLAKHDASAKALQDMFNVQATSITEIKISIKSATEKPRLVRAPWSDSFATLVEEKFVELTNASTYNKYGVLAGIIMTTGTDFAATQQLICLATGTKCLVGQRINEKGHVLADCHAEILCRRALLRYLYSQLSVMKDASLCVESIFERIPGKADRYRLKLNYCFHLYVSSAPCGDARVFAFGEGGEVPVDTGADKSNRSFLRAKVEKGQGTNPLDKKIAQTWENVAIGEPLRTMSCSDKVCLWNVVGLQGALLSRLVDPIYLRSIIIDNQFNQEHCERALVGRVPDVKLPLPYRLAVPTISTVLRSRKNEVKKAPDFALSWLLCDNGVEVIDSQSGRLSNSKAASRLCSNTLYTLYRTTIKNLAMEQQSDTYSTAKQEASPDYKAAKSVLEKAFEISNLGYWMHKPPEMDNFKATA